MKAIKALLFVFLLSIAGAGLEASAATSRNSSTTTSVAPKKTKKAKKKKARKKRCGCCGYSGSDVEYVWDSSHKCYLCHSCSVDVYR